MPRTEEGNTTRAPSREPTPLKILIDLFEDGPTASAPADFALTIEEGLATEVIGRLAEHGYFIVRAADHVDVSDTDQLLHFLGQ